MHTQIIQIDGYHLDNSSIISALKNSVIKVQLSKEANHTCGLVRMQIERWLVKDAPVVYGVNTGLGNLKDTVLSPEEHITWNKTIPYPHAIGFGDVLNPEVARTALLIRANVLARGYSAARPALIERMLDIYNAGISPVIYELGSTGLSDLSSLAQMVMVVAGMPEAEVFYKGNRLPAREGFKQAGIEPEFILECKEVLSQMNGSSITQALSVLTYEAFRDLFTQNSDKLFSVNNPLFTSMSEIIAYIGKVINFENNISCDNPLLFEIESNSYEAIMGCNCSNTQVGYVMDLLTILINDFSIWHMTQFDSTSTQYEHVVSISTQINPLITPASIDSIPTKGNQEDHVEFSYGAARKANKALMLLKRQLQL